MNLCCSDPARSLLASILLISGCAGSSVHTSRLETDYRLSPSALFHYRIPVGWEDHAAHLSGSQHVWLSGDDGRPTIIVSEIYTDPGASGLTIDGKVLAELLLSLDSGKAGVTLNEDLRMMTLRGETLWTYVLREKENLVSRIALLRRGKRYFEVRGTVRRVGEPVIQEFLEALRW